MYTIIDTKSPKGALTPVRGGFMTASQANNWAKRNLPAGETDFFLDKGNKIDPFRKRYAVIKK